MQKFGKIENQIRGSWRSLLPFRDLARTEFAAVKLERIPVDHKNKQETKTMQTRKTREQSKPTALWMFFPCALLSVRERTLIC